MKNEISTTEDNIKTMIYKIRGKQVMLDSDIAKLYQVATKRINEAVKNNPKKFPERYSWTLNNDEMEYLRSKFSTANDKTNNKRRYNPRVFTEQGIAMLATILKSPNVTQVSIAIMDAYISTRHFLRGNKLHCIGPLIRNKIQSKTLNMY